MSPYKVCISWTSGPSSSCPHSLQSFLRSTEIPVASLKAGEQTQKEINTVVGTGEWHLDIFSLCAQGGGCPGSPACPVECSTFQTREPSDHTEGQHWSRRDWGRSERGGPRQIPCCPHHKESPSSCAWQKAYFQKDLDTEPGLNDPRRSREKKSTIVKMGEWESVCWVWEPTFQGADTQGLWHSRSRTEWPRGMTKAPSMWDVIQGRSQFLSLSLCNRTLQVRGFFLNHRNSPSTLWSITQIRKDK